MRLITIRFSHFCEKARWALDRYGVGYQEEGHLPGFHVRAARRASPGSDADKAGSRWSTPILVRDDGPPLLDSRAIVRWVSDTYADGALYPDDEVAEVEQAIHDRLAVHSRRLAYAFLFDNRAHLRRLATANVPGFESAALAVALPLAVRALRKAMGITPAAAHRSQKIVDDELLRFGERLAGRRFLVGETFTAADLALACAVAPAVVAHRTEGYGAELPALDELPADYRALADRWRKTEVGRYTLRLFREERGQRVVPYGRAA